MVHLHLALTDYSFLEFKNSQENQQQLNGMEKFERIQKSATKTMKGLDYPFWDKIVGTLMGRWAVKESRDIC